MRASRRVRHARTCDAKLACAEALYWMLRLLVVARSKPTGANWRVNDARGCQHTGIPARYRYPAVGRRSREETESVTAQAKSPEDTHVMAVGGARQIEVHGTRGGKRYEGKERRERRRRRRRRGRRRRRRRSLVLRTS